MIQAAPDLIRLQAHRSVYSMVSKFIKDEQLREAFSFHSLLVGGNPFKSSSIYTLIHYLERSWGVWFPKGGTHALVRAMVKLFEDLGGKIRYGAEVEEILTQGPRGKGVVHGVTLAGGEHIDADLVVSNAEVMHTYSKLLRNEPKAGLKRFALKHSDYSMSLCLIYFGTKKKYPNMAHHTVIFGPRYKELLKDIFDNGVLADDFSLYVHAPSRTDPSLAPPDGEAFYVLSPVPHLGKAGHIDWEKEGEIYSNKILDFLEKSYLPGLRENIVTKRVITPKYFEQELNSHLGAAFSLQPLLTQSAYFRVKNRDPKIKGMYFVGAGTHPGAGVPGVVNSAKATASVILSDLATAAKKSKTSDAHVPAESHAH